MGKGRNLPTERPPPWHCFKYV
ncbi:hypothetical protein AYI68_g4171, partial [Smittium mucronatum]